MSRIMSDFLLTLIQDIFAKGLEYVADDGQFILNFLVNTNDLSTLYIREFSVSILLVVGMNNFNKQN